MALQQYQYEYRETQEEDDRYYLHGHSAANILYTGSESGRSQFEHSGEDELQQGLIKQQLQQDQDHMPLASDLQSDSSSLKTNRSLNEGDKILQNIKHQQLGKGINFDNEYFWNEQYQKLIDEPVTNPESARRKKMQLEELSQRFSTAAREVVVQLVEDFHIKNPKKRRHLPLDVGGIAGGTKYATKDMFFKFATDDQKLYHGDEFAAKAASAELRSLNALISAGIPHLHFPLMTIITYHGYSVICVSRLPINKNTLVYGSADAGNTIYDAYQVFKLMKQLCIFLNLKGHFVIERSTGKPKFIYGPVDIEGHLGFDGRLYILDTARLLPPTARIPKVAGSHLYKMMRPEFLQSYPKAISSDIFTRWGKPDADVNDVEGIEATNTLLQQVIPQFAAELHGQAKLRGQLRQHMHSCGVNMRFLGLVYECAPLESKPEILVEMVTREFKHMLFHQMRKAASSTASNEAYLQIVVSHFDNLINTHERAIRFWRNLQAGIKFKFFQHHTLLSDQQRQKLQNLRDQLAKSSASTDISIMSPDAYYQDDETSRSELPYGHNQLAISSISNKSGILPPEVMSLAPDPYLGNLRLSLEKEIPTLLERTSAFCGVKISGDFLRFGIDNKRNFELSDVSKITALVKRIKAQPFVASLKAEGKFDQVEDYYLKELNTRVETLGAFHVQVAYTLINLGDLYTEFDYREDAEEKYLEALRTLQELNDKSEDECLLMEKIGYFYAKYDQLERSQELFQQAVELKKKIFGENHIEVAQSLGDLANTLARKGQIEEASSLYERALKISQTKFGESHCEVANILNSQVQILLKQQDQLERAEPLCARVLKILEVERGPTHSDYAIALDNQGRLFQLLGRHAKALENFQKSIEIKCESLDPAHFQVAVSLDHSAQLLLMGDDPKEACTPILEKSKEILRDTVGLGHSANAIREHVGAVLAWKLGDREAAAAGFSTTVQIFSRSFGSSHYFTQVALQNQKLFIEEKNWKSFTPLFHDGYLSVAAQGRETIEAHQIPPEWKQLFLEAGIEESDLTDMDTIQLILETVGEDILSGVVFQEDQIAEEPTPTIVTTTKKLGEFLKTSDSPELYPAENQDYDTNSNQEYSYDRPMLIASSKTPAIQTEYSEYDINGSSEAEVGVIEEEDEQLESPRKSWAESWQVSPTHSPTQELKKMQISSGDFAKDYLTDDELQRHLQLQNVTRFDENRNTAPKIDHPESITEFSDDPTFVDQEPPTSPEASGFILRESELLNEKVSDINSKSASFGLNAQKKSFFSSLRDFLFPSWSVKKETTVATNLTHSDNTSSSFEDSLDPKFLPSADQNNNSNNTNNNNNNNNNNNGDDDNSRSIEDNENENSLTLRFKKAFSFFSERENLKRKATLFYESQPIPTSFNEDETVSQDENESCNSEEEKKDIKQKARHGKTSRKVEHQKIQQYEEMQKKQEHRQEIKREQEKQGEIQEREQEEIQRREKEEIQRREQQEEIQRREQEEIQRREQQEEIQRREKEEIQRRKHQEIQRREKEEIQRRKHEEIQRREQQEEKEKKEKEKKEKEKKEKEEKEKEKKEEKEKREKQDKDQRKKKDKRKMEKKPLKPLPAQRERFDPKPLDPAAPPPKPLAQSGPAPPPSAPRMLRQSIGLPQKSISTLALKKDEIPAAQLKTPTVTSTPVRGSGASRGGLILFGKANSPSSNVAMLKNLAKPNVSSVAYLDQSGSAADKHTRHVGAASGAASSVPTGSVSSSSSSTSTVSSARGPPSRDSLERKSSVPRTESSTRAAEVLPSSVAKPTMASLFTGSKSRRRASMVMDEDIRLMEEKNRLEQEKLQSMRAHQDDNLTSDDSESFHDDSDSEVDEEELKRISMGSWLDSEPSPWASKPQKQQQQQQQQPKFSSLFYSKDEKAAPRPAPQPASTALPQITSIKDKQALLEKLKKKMEEKKQMK